MSSLPKILSALPPQDTGTPSGTLRILAEAKLPTRHGFFRIVSFAYESQRIDHVAIIQGEIREQEEVPARIHSECLTGDVFDSLRCDCRQQLEFALKELGESERGVILYLRQEGRGIGIANKVAAYSLQDQGLDTVDANLHLGFDDDLRDYEVAVEMLKLLGPTSLVLMTNNPRKVDQLASGGIQISQRLPIVIPPNPHNRRYLETKRTKSGHLLGVD